MSAQHTPGPWSVEIDDPSGIGRTHAVYVCGAGGWPEGQLARVNVQDGLAEREANASLIAAAPDLLEALNAELAELEEDIRWAETPDLARMISRRERIEAAIAKATGA